MRTCFTKLPPKEFAFGANTSPLKDEDTAASLLRNYDYETKAKVKDPDVLDFKRINKIKLKGTVDKQVSQILTIILQ